MNDMIQEDLREAGYEVDGAYDGLEGIAKLGFKRYHLILLDIRMPRKNGLEVLDFIREHCPEIQVVIMTALATQPDVEQKIRNGAVACLKKPFRLEDLQETIRKALSSTEIEENQN
ncbi:MAG: response regulator [Desulfobulbaceae bacterium]|nr:response regulator [Desulfobulbaceae bacterium]